MGIACLSLGSNMMPEANLRSAIAALRTRFGSLRVSTVYRTAAIGFDGADFLNAGAVIDSDLDPFALDAWLHALEDAHGRDRSGPRFGDRTLDLDLVLYDDLIVDGVAFDGATLGGGPAQPGEGHSGSGQGQALRLPREDLRHAFVLRPLAEIAPDIVEPRSGLTLAELWARSPARDTAMQDVDL